jgi:hypothetical protein
MRRLSSLGSSIVRVIHALFERNCGAEMHRRAPDKGVQPMRVAAHSAYRAVERGLIK